MQKLCLLLDSFGHTPASRHNIMISIQNVDGNRFLCLVLTWSFYLVLLSSWKCQLLLKTQHWLRWTTGSFQVVWNSCLYHSRDARMSFWVHYCLAFLSFRLGVFFVEKFNYFTFERMELDISGCGSLGIILANHCSLEIWRGLNGMQRSGWER